MRLSLILIAPLGPIAGPCRDLESGLTGVHRHFADTM